MNLRPILPAQIDVADRVHPAANALLAAVLLMKTAIALGPIFNGRVAAQSADGIPLETFGPGGAATVLAVFAIWGVAQLVISAFGVLALVRYRALIPLMFVLLLLEHAARRLALMALPVARTGAPPGVFVNLAILALMIAGLGFALRASPRTEGRS